MFIKPLVMTIDELAARWAKHNINESQLLELCRQSQLEMVFPADGREFWAHIKNKYDKPVIVARCRISGYVRINQESLGELIIKNRLDEWQAVALPDLDHDSDLFEITQWSEPELDWLQKTRLGYTGISYQATPENLENFYFRPALQSMVLLPFESMPTPLNEIDPQITRDLIDALNEGNDKMVSFDHSANGQFKLYQARITYRSIETYEEMQEHISPQNTQTQKTGLGIRERKTLINIIYGMAVTKYGYDPKGSKNTATGKKSRSISADLEEQGIHVTAETIRKYLNEFD